MKNLMKKQINEIIHMILFLLYIKPEKQEFVNKTLKEGVKKSSRNYGIGLTTLRNWIKDKISL